MRHMSTLEGWERTANVAVSLERYFAPNNTLTNLKPTSCFEIPMLESRCHPVDFLAA